MADLRYLRRCRRDSPLPIRRANGVAALGDPESSAEELGPYRKLVYWMARRLLRRLPSYVERDDVVQQGWLGILQAKRRFDPSRENNFSTFARFRVQGAMLDYIRRDWSFALLSRSPKRCLSSTGMCVVRQAPKTYDI